MEHRWEVHWENSCGWTEMESVDAPKKRIWVRYTSIYSDGTIDIGNDITAPSPDSFWWSMGFWYSTSQWFILVTKRSDKSGTRSQRTIRDDVGEDWYSRNPPPEIVPVTFHKLAVWSRQRLRVGYWCSCFIAYISGWSAKRMTEVAVLVYLLYRKPDTLPNERSKPDIPIGESGSLKNCWYPNKCSRDRKNK